MAASDSERCGGTQTQQTWAKVGLCWSLPDMLKDLGSNTTVQKGEGEKRGKEGREGGKEGGKEGRE